MKRRYEVFYTVTIKRGGCVEVEADNPEEAKAIVMAFLTESDETNVTRSWPDCVSMDDPKYILDEPTTKRVIDGMLEGCL
jgi:hypothetical protein